MNELVKHQKSDEIINSLPEEKRLLIEKYSLILTEHMIWITIKENSFPHKICRHQFLLKTDIIGLLFRLNEICFAKLKYFRDNMPQFEPYTYDYKEGFRKTQLWNAEFFKHLSSGYMIDIRYLQKIKEIEEFRKFCLIIENNNL